MQNGIYSHDIVIKLVKDCIGKATKKCAAIVSRDDRMDFGRIGQGLHTDAELVYEFASQAGSLSFIPSVGMIDVFLGGDCDS